VGETLAQSRVFNLNFAFLKRVLNPHEYLQMFEPSPRLTRAIEHHELRREEELMVAFKKSLERPKTAPSASLPTCVQKPKHNISASAKKAAKGIQREVEYPSDSEAIADMDGSIVQSNADAGYT
jgi:hypothetical protein